MVSRIEILGRFPTKENLFRFIKAYYKMFSKKLEITLNNFDEDLINSYVGSYWKFWTSLANSIGMNKDDPRQFFLIMNCIALLLPVYSTVPSTSPRTTVEPILQESPLYIVTGKDSPVSAAWSTSISP